MLDAISIFQDLLINKANGGGGYLYNRLRYLRKMEKEKSKPTKQKNHSPKNNETEGAAPSLDAGNRIVVDSNQTSDNSNPTPHQVDDLLWLKTIVVNEQNMPEIHEKLRKTFERRRSLLNSENVNMLENFPFMFVHPQLVS